MPKNKNKSNKVNTPKISVPKQFNTEFTNSLNKILNSNLKFKGNAVKKLIDTERAVRLAKTRAPQAVGTAILQTGAGIATPIASGNATYALSQANALANNVQDIDLSDPKNQASSGGGRMS